MYLAHFSTSFLGPLSWTMSLFCAGSGKLIMTWNKPRERVLTSGRSGPPTLEASKWPEGWQCLGKLCYLWKFVTNLTNPLSLLPDDGAVELLFDN